MLDVRVGVNIYFIDVFLLQDFATPSLTEEDTNFLTEDNAVLERRVIEQFQLRRHWESRLNSCLFKCYIAEFLNVIFFVTALL